MVGGAVIGGETSDATELLRGPPVTILPPTGNAMEGGACGVDADATM